MEGHMTGLSVRTLTPGRKPGGETRGSFITRVQLALISVKESAKKAIRVSSLMVFSSVGCTQHGTGLSRVRMVPVVKGGSVFSLTHQNSSGCYHNRVREETGRFRAIWITLGLQYVIVSI